MGRPFIQIDADHVRPFLRYTVGGRFANAAAGADDDDHIACQFFFGRHTLELGLFELPVFDVECFLARQALVFADGLRGAHHFNGQGIEFGRYATFALVLAPGDETDAGDENHTRVWIAHGG